MQKKTKYAQVPVALLCDDRLGKRELKCACLLWAHANNETGECRPSLDRIAELAGWYITKNGERVADRWLASKVVGELEKLGWIKKKKRLGYNMTNAYWLAEENESATNNEAKDRKEDTESYKTRKKEEQRASEGYKKWEAQFGEKEKAQIQRAWDRETLKWHSEQFRAGKVRYEQLPPEETFRAAGLEKPDDLDFGIDELPDEYS